jgi:hypothetical protein
MHTDLRQCHRSLHAASLAALSAGIILILSGCGDKDRNPDPPPKPVGQNNIAGDLIATKDRARDGVNKAMEENQKKLDDAMHKQDIESGESSSTQ